jgi:DNA-binding NarL/FixJ family response regulator
LRLLLEREGFEIVGEACDGHEAVRLAMQLRPDVAVLDLAMPLMNGVDAGRQVQQASPGTRTILLTGGATEQQILEALRAGVRACIAKSHEARELILGIREVSQGRVYLSPGLAGTVVSAYLGQRDAPAYPLTPRERQVLQLIAEGKTTKETAGLLGVSVKTAESHRMHITSKLGIRETAGFVRYAIRQGLSSL